MGTMELGLTQLANIGEFIGGIAVLVTLVYLAFQVRSNTNSERAETHRSFVEELNRAFLTPMQDLEKAALFRRGASSFRSLNGDEQMVVGAFWQSLFLLLQEAHILNRAGSIDDDLAKALEDFTVAFVQVPGVAEWWDATAGGHSLSFQTHVADLLRSSHEIPPFTESWTWFADASHSPGDE